MASCFAKNIAKGGLYLRHAFRSARNLSAAIPDIVVRWTWTWRRARQERQTRTARQDGKTRFYLILIKRRGGGVLAIGSFIQGSTP